MKSRLLTKLIGFWPPYLGAGIRVVESDEAFRDVLVEMKLRFWNRNYVGSHFGGSLYAMTDPFYMLMLIQNLGPEYIVWDKAATIRFKKPGRGKVRARFQLSEEQLASFRAQAAGGEKVEPVFMVRVEGAEGELVAEVEKTLYIRKKLPRSGGKGNFE